MRPLILATLTAAVVATAAPAMSQTVDELIITGRLPDDQAQSISAPVVYSDLDLTYGPDRDVLRQRISAKARELCNRLNEPPPGAATLGRSCQEIAIRNAQGQVWAAIDDAYAQRTYAANDYPPD